MDFKNFGTVVLNYLTDFQEDSTAAVKTIDVDHAYIHESIMFSATDYQTLTAGSTSFITALTPGTASGTFIHWRPTAIASSGDKVLMTLYEGSSAPTASGTITPYNRDRGSSLTSTMTVTSATAASTTMGTAIDRVYIGGGTNVGGNVVGAESGEKNEIIFKQDTRYIMSIANGSSAANVIMSKMMWYEQHD